MEEKWQKAWKAVGDTWKEEPQREEGHHELGLSPMGDPHRAGAPSWTISISQSRGAAREEPLALT